jgi:hypothetical protein
VGSFAFDASRDTVTSFPDCGTTESELTDAYHRVALPIVQQARGYQVMHASAIRTTRGVVAFCGVSGIGKSTTALAFGRRGYPVWGDDAVCFDTSQNPIRAISLPFARIVQSGSRDDRSAVAPLSAVCVLQKPSNLGDGGAVHVAAVDTAAAFTATLEHAYSLGLGDRDRRTRLIEGYLRLAASTPVLVVRPARGLDHLESLVEAIEQRLALEPPPG